MNDLVFLGAGTAGTTLANRMRRQLSGDWRVTVVDPAEQHLYQPGLLFLPFGAHDEDRMVRPRADTLARGVEWRKAEVDVVDPMKQEVRLVGGDRLHYDTLVIASGARLRPELTEGLLGPRWQRSIFDFYSLEGARALRSALAAFDGGRLVIDIVEMPIKCPVAPLELAFLADAYFTDRGIRRDVEIVYVTPLDGAFTRPVASRKLGYLLDEKKIDVVTEFSTSAIAEDEDALVSYDGRRVPFDLLVTVPTHSGAAFVERSGIGDELAFVPTDPKTLAAKSLPNVFVLGDATDLPTSKAGSVAHFEADVLERNLTNILHGRPPLAEFDGHANCFVETGHGKAMLIDFNYDVEPLPGVFPLPGLGPLRLLEETRANHLGKLAFRWMYWHRLLPGRSVGVPAKLSLRGKHRPATNVPPTAV